MVGNKADLVSDRTVPTEEGATLARELGCCGSLETSATQGEGGNIDTIEKVFFDLIRARRKLDKEDKAPDQNSGSRQHSASRSRKKDIKERAVEKTMTFHRRCCKVVSLLPELSDSLAKAVKEYIRDRKREGLTF
jgi:hypothetical protein